MNAAVENFASHNFANYQMKNIRVDQDNAGLFCKVPDQSGNWMTVRCAESKIAVTPTSCSCGKSNCKHQAIVSSYYGKLYKVETPVVEEAPVAKTRKPRNGLVRKTRNGGLVLVKQPAPVAQPTPAAKVIEMPAPNKDMMNAALTTNQGFRMMK